MLGLKPREGYLKRCFLLTANEVLILELYKRGNLKVTPALHSDWLGM